MRSMPAQPTTGNRVCFGFWNMQDLSWVESAEERERAELGYRVIAEQIRPDVFAIAELRPGCDDLARDAERASRGWPTPRGWNTSTRRAKPP